MLRRQKSSTHHIDDSVVNWTSTTTATGFHRDAWYERVTHPWTRAKMSQFCTRMLTVGAYAYSQSTTNKKYTKEWPRGTSYIVYCFVVLKSALVVLRWESLAAGNLRISIARRVISHTRKKYNNPAIYSRRVGHCFIGMKKYTDEFIAENITRHLVNWPCPTDVG